jgi:hypothetical protein
MHQLKDKLKRYLANMLKERILKTPRSLKADSHVTQAQKHKPPVTQFSPKFPGSAMLEAFIKLNRLHTLFGYRG